MEEAGGDRKRIRMCQGGRIVGKLGRGRKKSEGKIIVF